MRFHKEVLPRIAALAADLQQQPDEPEDERSLSSKWLPCRSILQDVGAMLPQSTIELSDIAPGLCAVPSDAALPIPGAPHGALSRTSASSDFIAA